MSETTVQSALFMDRDGPLGNSQDVYGRRALHTKIGNSTDEPIPVTITDAVVSSDEVVNQFGTAAAVVGGVETVISSYTVPPAKQFDFSMAQFSGTNIALFNVYIDSILVATSRTMFGSLSGKLNFDTNRGSSLNLAAGQLIELKVLHQRPSLGDFEGRILGVEKNA